MEGLSTRARRLQGRCYHKVSFTAVVLNLFDFAAPYQEFIQLVVPCEKRYIICGTLEKLNQFDEGFVTPKMYFYSLILKENHECLAGPDLDHERPRLFHFVRPNSSSVV